MNLTTLPIMPHITVYKETWSTIWPDDHISVKLTVSKPH